MIPKLLILEGPDCSGKTTLAKHIWNVIPHSVYWHLTSTPALNEAMYDYQMEAITNLLRLVEAGQVVVLDRFWPSELVYSKVLRPQHYPCAVQHWQEFHDLVVGIDGVYIFCDDSEVEKRHEAKQDPKHPYDAEKFAQIVQGYRELADNLIHEDYLVKYNQIVHGHQLHRFMDILFSLRKA